METGTGFAPLRQPFTHEHEAVVGRAQMRHHPTPVHTSRSGPEHEPVFDAEAFDLVSEGLSALELTGPTERGDAERFGERDADGVS